MEDSQELVMPEQGIMQNISVLDLTGTKAADELSAIRAIKNVGVVVVPESLMGALMKIPMENIGGTVPVPEGASVRLHAHTGQITLTGDALANTGGNEDDILILTGQTIITSDVERVGYRQCVVTGQLIAPKGSEAAISAGVTRLTGQVFYYDNANPRFWIGSETFSSAFFQYITDPITMVLVGEFTFENDVTVDTLRGKVTDISLMGRIVAPKELVPFLQFITRAKMGTIIEPSVADEQSVQSGDDE